MLFVLADIERQINPSLVHNISWVERGEDYLEQQTPLSYFKLFLTSKREKSGLNK